MRQARGKAAGRSLLALAACALLQLGAPFAAAPALRPAELDAILAHGPWPPELSSDPSNRVSRQPAARAFGEELFHSSRLSRTPGLRCASCHEPWRRFTDGLPRGMGASAGERNTPTLLNVSLQRWFGWDGANDTLWAQSIRPLLDPREMSSDAPFVAAAVRGDERYRRLYREAFGAEPGADDTQVMVDLAKAMAAYQETLLSARTPFDDFRDALARGDPAAAAAYPEPAQRGLRLFVGKAACASCHAGPLFSDGRFHASAIGHDEGRPAALKRWIASPFTRAGRYNDGAPALEAEAAQAGAFRTPGLREVEATGPWMHDGSVANLCETLAPHAGEASRPALTLRERQDLVAFLRSLSAEPPALPDEASLRCR